jgi:hypothetical protein
LVDQLDTYHTNFFSLLKTRERKVNAENLM